MITIHEKMNKEKINPFYSAYSVDIFDKYVYTDEPNAIYYQNYCDCEFACEEQLQKY